MANRILVPPLGQTTDSVILSAWYKQKGEPVKAGEALFAIETDKATLDIEAQESGILAQVNAQAGEEVKVLSSIGLIAAPGEVVSAGEGESRRGGAGERGSKGEGEQQQPQETRKTEPDGQVTSVAAKPQERAVPVVKRESAEGERVFISPRARRLAIAENVRWQQISGSGPEGAIVERDIRQYIAQMGHMQPEPQALIQTYTISPAQQAQTMMAQADVSALVELCERYARRELAVSLESIYIYILAREAKEALAQESLSIGYVRPGQAGFVMPVVENANGKGLVTLTREINELVAHAQKGDLQSAQQDAPSIAFSSLAGLGIDLFTPVIETPGTPILSVGRARHNRVGEVLVWFNLSYAGTNLDALTAARLLRRVVERVEDPDLMF